MKYLPMIFITLLSFVATAQSEWKGVYSDSSMVRLPDSTLSAMAAGITAQMKEKGLPDDAIDELLKKIETAPAYFRTGMRYVTAVADSTLITTESSDNRVQKILLKHDELYFRTPSGNYDSLFEAPRKNFKVSGRQLVLLDHKCEEYISTDSTVIICVAEDLPSGINPGIRTGLKGAVLLYELKTAGFVLVCRITKIERQNIKN